MHVLVVYESSYGNTHLIADAIGEGLGADHTVTVVPVGKVTKELVDPVDLIVVGGPTHVHGMSRTATRAQAANAAHQPGSSLVLDPDAEGRGLREWFEVLPAGTAFGAAFDTRLDASPLFTGRASKGINKQLHRHGFREITEPISFLVTKETQLAEGQQDAARQWGQLLAARLTQQADTSPVN